MEVDSLNEQMRQVQEELKKSQFEALWPLVKKIVSYFLHSEHKGKEQYWEDMQAEASLRLWQLVKVGKVDVNRSAGDVVQYLSKIMQRVLREFSTDPVTSQVEGRGEEGKAVSMPSWVSDDQYQALLSTLTEGRRAMVVLSLFSGYSQKEVAAMMQVSEATVSNVVRRFKAELKKLMMES